MITEHFEVRKEIAIASLHYLRCSRQTADLSVTLRMAKCDALPRKTVLKDVKENIFCANYLA